MLLEKGFEIIYNVVNVGSIKSWKAGENNGVKFPPSVKFRSTNIESKEDKDVGVREVETIVDFQVQTETLEQAILLTEKIRSMRANKKEILISGVLPRKEGTDDILVIKSVEPFEEFLKRNNISLDGKK